MDRREKGTEGLLWTGEKRGLKDCYGQERKGTEGLLWTGEKRGLKDCYGQEGKGD